MFWTCGLLFGLQQLIYNKVFLLNFSLTQKKTLSSQVHWATTLNSGAYEMSSVIKQYTY